MIINDAILKEKRKNKVQIRMKGKSLKGIVGCCKFQILFKNKKLSNTFCLKDRVAEMLTSSAVNVSVCNESYYGVCARHLNVRIREHISESH